MQNLLKKILAPNFAFGAFIFYIYWTSPVSLILQQYSIQHWFFWDNPITPIALIVIAIITLLLLIFCIPKLNGLYITLSSFILFALILTLLYQHIFPYNYGGITDNSTLTPKNSLLDFGKWRYIFDVVLISASITVVYFLNKFKAQNVAFMFFIIFYTSLNLITIWNTHQSISKGSKNSSEYILSKNNKNVVFFIYDGFDPRTVQYFLTNNSMPSDIIGWAKDFTFYDNVTALGTPTISSISSMFKGVQRNALNLLKESYTEKNSESYYYYAPIQKFNSMLENNNINVSCVGATLPDHIPILALTSYAYMPYFTRHTVASEHGWKVDSPNKWTDSSSSLESINTKVVDSTNNMYFFHWTQKSHSPWKSKEATRHYSRSASLEDIEHILYYNTKDVFNEINTFIANLKENNIYDNTKIIIASDHGTHGHTNIYEFVSKISKNFSNVIVSQPNSPEVENIRMLNSLLMIKDYNKNNKTMLVDNRFLSLGDIPAIIESSLGIATTNIDYTTIQPPKRIFNILSKNFRSLRTNDVVPILILSNINSFSGKSINISTNELDQYPPFEIIK